MATQKPDLTRVWASSAPSGNVVDPDTTTPGKVAAGWQAEVPPFEHFNFLQKWFTQGLAHFNEQGIAVWDTDTTYPIDGLAKGSDGRLYKALVEQNGNDPVSDSGVNWELFSRSANVLNIKDFGAIGDGLVDDTAAIQLAFDQGKSVYIPDGDFKFTSGLTWLNDGCKLFGTGRLVGVGSTAALGGGISIVNTDNVWVDGIRMYASGAYLGIQTFYGDNFNATKPNTKQYYEKVKITNCDIDCSDHTAIEQGHNISVKPFINATVRKVHIKDNFVQGSGISPDYVTDGNGSDNIYVASYGIDNILAPMEEVIITGNSCRYAGRQNISVAGDPGNGPNYVCIGNNTLRDSTFGGVDLEYGGRVSIVGNSFINNGMSQHLINPDDAFQTSIRAGISFASAAGAEQSGNESVCSGNTFDHCYVAINGYQQTISECTFINTPVTVGSFASALTNMSNVTFIVDDTRPDLILINVYDPNQSHHIKNIRIVDKVSNRTVEAISIRGIAGSTSVASIDGFTYITTNSNKNSPLLTTNGAKLIIRGMTVDGYSYNLFDQVNAGGALEIQDSNITADSLTDGNANGDTSLVISNSTITLGQLDVGSANPNDTTSELRIENSRIKMTVASTGMTINRKIRIVNNEFDLRGLTGNVLNLYPQTDPLVPFMMVDIKNNEIIMDGTGCRLVAVNTAAAANWCVPDITNNTLNCAHTPTVMGAIFNGKVATGVVDYQDKNYFTNGSTSAVTAMALS